MILEYLNLKIKRRINDVGNKIDINNVRAYYEMYFSDIELINVKEDIYNLPYEKVKI